MKALKHIPRTSDDQARFGEKLGLDLRGCTLSVAMARIEDAVDIGLHGTLNLGNPAPKQIAFAATFRYDIAGLSRREGDAVVDDLMTELNHEAIEAEGLVPGVTVVNIHDSTGSTFVISSVHPDGTVYTRRQRSEDLGMQPPESSNDAEAVTGSGVIDELGQGRAVEALTRDDVGEDANGARLNEPVALGVGILVVGRDASVAQGVAHAGHRLNIVRFRDGFTMGHFTSIPGFRSVSLFVSILWAVSK